MSSGVVRFAVFSGRRRCPVRRARRQLLGLGWEGRRLERALRFRLASTSITLIRARLARQQFRRSWARRDQDPARPAGDLPARR